MRYRKLGLLLGLALIAIAAVGTASAASNSSSAGIPIIPDSQLKAEFTEVGGGAGPLPTTRTIPHWWGSTANPDDKTTYGYNMVGADPSNCGTACDSTIQADITPVIVNVGGMTFDPTASINGGNSVVQGTLDSPQFATNDYGTTPAATGPDIFDPGHNDDPSTCSTANGDICLPKGPGGTLSQGDAGIPLQLEDATMRAQYNQTGASNYHVRLNPHVLAPVTINVPQNQGGLLKSGRGVIFGEVSISWWSSQIKNLETTANPTHLPIYLTDSILLYIGAPGNCCVLGYHGTEATGARKGNGQSQGNTAMQTFAWASWVRPGIYARANGGTDWALQDIHALSHEIAEWGDDPFVNNLVEPWLTPTAPQYGCTNILETGDPVVSIGFSMGTNTTDQTGNPNGTTSYDGTYHPEDETLLPWFMRTAPNTVSEPTQSASANGGRYTLMGDLNPFPGFRAPATGC
jgi:hypothetical protein